MDVYQTSKRELFGRAAASVNIIYKARDNDAVAMIGGQSAEGGFTIPQIVAQVAGEGAVRVVVISEVLQGRV